MLQPFMSVTHFHMHVKIRHFWDSFAKFAGLSEMHVPPARKVCCERQKELKAIRGSVIIHSGSHAIYLKVWGLFHS